MRNVTLKAAVLAAFGLISAQAMATGLVSLPAAGFSVSSGTNQPVGGTSAYTLCNQTGGFGTGTYTAPTTGANNTCAVFPGSINTSPVSGFTSVASTTGTLITANGETVATMDQRVFRNAANTECIYGKRISMSTTATFDYNSGLAGQQFLEVNDVTLGGFSGTTNVSAGYYHTSISDSPVYRQGRAFTAVRYRNTDDSATTALFPALSGYLIRPITSPAPASSTEINGPTGTGSSATTAQQTAEIRTNWVDFTMDNTGGVDEDGTTEKDTSMLYVRANCNSVAPITLTNSVRIHQTGQETQPFVTILTSGQAVSTANANF